MLHQPMSIHKLVSLFLIALLIVGAVVWFSPIFSGKREYFRAAFEGRTAEVTVGSLSVRSEVMKTPQELAQGLSERAALAPGYGMLFDLNVPQNISFWMKGMRFDLDMIWISDNKVIGIDRDIPFPREGEEPVVIQSPGVVRYVLELVPGQTDSISVGDDVIIR